MHGPRIQHAPVTRYQLAEFARAIAEPARAAILLALIDDRARPAGELAQIAQVTAATASAHLRQLCDIGLLRVHVQGRHRYYQLADEEIAHLVETLALASERRVPATPARRDAAFVRARTCYHHLAGRLGVALFERLRAAEGLALASDAIRLSAKGVVLLRDAGLEEDESSLLRLCGRTCVDWTERRLHLSGPLGSAIARRLLDHDWLRPQHEGRALRISTRGRAGLRALGVELD
ncbi:MAG: metalloregulator ArsR/SmtB family transcription factor [Dokdonella sp.]